MMKFTPFILLLLLAAARADVKLPAFFSDHMVLQAERDAAIWGWAAPGEKVTASLGNKSSGATADAHGRWELKLPTGAASSQPCTLTVSAKNTIAVSDVLIGEVWLAAGQSNMEMTLRDPRHGAVDHADEEIAAANYPSIRVFVHEAPFSIYGTAVPPSEPLADRPGHWTVCTPQTAAEFSAMGYFFARDLHRSLKRPLGIITAAVGGTPIEAWTSLPAQQREPAFASLLANWQKQLTGYDPVQAETAFLEQKKTWLKARAAATKAGEPAPKAPSPFKNNAVMAPGVLFNAYIAPVIPYTVRGCIWYQGERNANGPFTGLYGAQLETMIRDWRARWHDDFHFAWVQLPGFSRPQTQPSEAAGWGVSVREGMRRALRLPHTSMAITIDLGGEKAGHPTNKSEFAARLSKVVLHDVYGDSSRVWSGPLFRGFERSGARMLLHFGHADGPRPASGEKLTGFAIAGPDRKFVWAEAAVKNGRVEVSAADVPEPVAVRYAWAANPIGNLVNEAGLPASPFRTDDWDK